MEKLKTQLMWLDTVLNKLSCSLLDILIFRTVNFKQACVELFMYFTIWCFKLGSFGDQCYVAMATLACEIYSKMIYRAAQIKKKHGDPQSFSLYYVTNNVG